MDYLLYFLVFIQYVLLIAMVFILTYIGYVMFTYRNIIPYAPTPKKIIKKMIQLAEIKKHEKVADLGSGTGRILIEVAKRHSQNLLIGVEKSTVLRLITKIKLFFKPNLKKRIQINNHDMFNLDLSEFDVILCFLTPEALRILTPRLKRLKRGSRLVCYMFDLEDSQGFIEKRFHLTSKHSVYLYTKN